MKTKREVLKLFSQRGFCANLKCTECPYNENGCKENLFERLDLRLAKVGAMAILRQNRKKRELDPNKVLTCVTADQAKVGMKGYFADNLATLRERFARKNIQTLTRSFGEDYYARFEADNFSCWMLFCPIDEELENDNI